MSSGLGSPSKGKGTDSTWRASWWDFYPLLERPRRQIQWSNSSVIFTAHPTKPLITGRHFSSSKRFVLPSPAPVALSPASYDPPSVITVAATDEWLFAYFPRRDGEGTGCIWKRGPQIDSWDVKESWSFPKGGGAVTASWLGNPREWAINASDNPVRLPPRGPATPLSNPTIVIVTQDHHVHVSYLRYYFPSIRTLKRPLAFPGVTVEQPQMNDPLESASGNRQCLDAAIGFGYNESSFLVATYSRRVPPPPLASPMTAPIAPFNSMDLSIPVDAPQLLQEPRPMDWETSGDERTIELFEVHLRFDASYMMAVISNPLPPMDYVATSLTNLVFICAPPAPASPVPPDLIRSPSLRKPNVVEKGKMYLSIASLDFHNYSAPPTSQLLLYSLTHKSVIRGSAWTVHLEASRSFQSSVVTYIKPFVDFSSPNAAQIYACLINTSVSLAQDKQSRRKETPVGAIKVLNIKDLGDNADYEQVEIEWPTSQIGVDLPLFATVSPNSTLLCTVSSSILLSQTATHSLPKPIESSTSQSNLPQLSLFLVKSILGRISSADVIHSICSTNIHLADSEEILYRALDVLERHKPGMPYSSTWEIMGIAGEVYKMKASLSKDDLEIADFNNRWHTAHDVCSIAACNIGFEDCKEGETYDLEGVWQLIKMSTWIVDFTEQLLKACVLWSNPVAEMEEIVPVDLHISSIAPTVPILLHITHPFTLQNLIAALKHVRTFRTFLGSLPAGGENSQIAKEVLIDVVDCSGVDFESLILILEENLVKVQKFDTQECRRALARCQPSGIAQAYLNQIIHKLTQPATILNKSTLFIKPYDLVDGITRLSVGTYRKDNEKDVVTKGMLMKTSAKSVCLRCGGKTAVDKDVRVSGVTSSKWRTWEKMWFLRCVCGGPWSTLPAI
ncbi:hypothetical protein B0H34DRAFT_650242 [Crassisporium funariophilum]|nr:hypothetical protein B0H34DRAFT_650242 [Crassisporium funariophilum]